MIYRYRKNSDLIYPFSVCNHQDFFFDFNNCTNNGSLFSSNFERPISFFSNRLYISVFCHLFLHRLYFIVSVPGFRINRQNLSVADRYTIFVLVKFCIFNVYFYHRRNFISVIFCFVRYIIVSRFFYPNQSSVCCCPLSISLFKENSAKLLKA